MPRLAASALTMYMGNIQPGLQGSLQTDVRVPAKEMALLRARLWRKLPSDFGGSSQFRFLGLCADADLVPICVSICSLGDDLGSASPSLPHMFCN